MTRGREEEGERERERGREGERERGREGEKESVGWVSKMGLSSSKYSMCVLGRR